MQNQNNNINNSRILSDSEEDYNESDNEFCESDDNVDDQIFIDAVNRFLRKRCCCDIRCVVKNICKLKNTEIIYITRLK